jgi:predicted nucleic acid-binding protein
MIHLDTNLLVDLVTVGSEGGLRILDWLRKGRKIGASSIAWSEFCNGPLTREQKEAAFRVLDGWIVDFTWREAEDAARFFNLAGRRKGSHADCMIAATAMRAGASLATFNAGDFTRLVPLGLVLEAME